MDTQGQLPDLSVPLLRIYMVRDASFNVKRIKIRDYPDVTAILKNYFKDLDREHCVALLLDAKHNIIGLNRISEGSVEASLVHPREVMKPAILANAVAVILAHNHPSGDPTPSEQDITLTNRIREACFLLGFQFLDHVIVGDPDSYSFAERGLLVGEGPWKQKW